MILGKKTILSNFGWRSIGISLIVLFVMLLPTTSVYALNYYAWGHVYTATPLPEGSELPENPLSVIYSSNPERIIGDDLIPVEPRNMVMVRIMKINSSGDEEELGNTMVQNGGGYFIHWTGSGGAISARYIVEDVATGQVLLESEAQTLTDGVGVNIRYLLTLESNMPVAGDRDFQEANTAGKYTAVFTRVGKIELETEVGGTNYRLIDNTTGEATVPAGVSTYLHIPKYEDSPFGGNLYLFGAFSQALYSRPTEVFYRIYRAPYSNPTLKTYLQSTLEKTKYTIDFSTGHVNTQRVTLGPLDAADVGGIEHCYRLTPLSSGSNVFWSFPDLLLLWPTGTLDGKYKIGVEIIDLADSDPDDPDDFEPIDNFTAFTMKLNNAVPKAKIEPFTGPFVAVGTLAGAESPYVYTCCTTGGNPPAPASNDLMSGLVPGSTFPDHYGGSADPTCAILNIEPTPPGTKYLAFRLTAHEPNDYLREWAFWYKRNDGVGETLLGKRYNGATASMVNLDGVRVSSSENSLGGFERKYLYISDNYLNPVGVTVGSCGYTFSLKAFSRTTDGYHYLMYRWDHDVHYIQR